MRGIWLARDSNGELYAYDKKPIRKEKNMHIPIFINQYDGHCMYIGGYSHYQIVTYENSPVFIPLTTQFLEQCLDQSKTHCIMFGYTHRKSIGCLTSKPDKA